jgi:hypothetical protein
MTVMVGAIVIVPFLSLTSIHTPRRPVPSPSKRIGNGVLHLALLAVILSLSENVP